MSVISKTSNHRFSSFILAGILVLNGLVLLAPRASAVSENWFVKDLGKPYNGTFNNSQGLADVSVGDGDNDNASEVYVSSWDNGHIYRFAQSGGNWKSDDLGQLADEPSHGWSIKVGDADDDGLQEIYSGIFLTENVSWPQNYIYELAKTETGWNKTLMGAVGNESLQIAIGDGNNDGRKELFSSDMDSHIYMFSKALEWNCQDIGYSSLDNTGEWARNVVVGDGHNDGLNRVYDSNEDCSIYEFTHSDTGWVCKKIWTWDFMEPFTNDNTVTIGDADNDGKNEIYSYQIPYICMLKWNSTNNAWDSTTIANDVSDPEWWRDDQTSSICIGDVNGDGKNEIYASNSNNLFQISDTGGSWKTTLVASAGAHINTIAIGSAAGDPKQQEIYAAGYDGHLYQFYTDTAPPANPIAWSDTHPVPETWYDQNVVHVLWKDVGSDISGLAGYSILWDNNPKTLPKNKLDFKSSVHDAYSPKLSDRKDWYFHIRACDGAGNWNATATTFGPIYIDTTPPDILGFGLNGGAGCTNDPNVTLSINATDPSPGSGLGWMSFSNYGNNWTDWEPFCSTRTGWDLTDSRFGGTDSDGMKYVYLKIKDLVGNEVAVINRASASILLDRVAPIRLSIVIDENAPFTNSENVSLALNALDPEPASGLSGMSFSNDGVSWSDWTGWANKMPWSLSQGAGGIDIDGNKTIYFRAQDLAGNIGGPASASVFLDRKPPGQLRLTIDDGAAYTNSSTVDLSIAVNDQDPSSGVREMALANDATSLDTWNYFCSTWTGWSLVEGAGGFDSDGPKAVYLKVMDGAGNVGGPVNGTIFLDRVKPVALSIVINDGAVFTTSIFIDLSLNASDAGPSSGLWAMQFGEDGAHWGEWEPFANHGQYELSWADGTKTVYFRVKDHAGNIADMVSGSIILDHTLPIISGVTVTGITDRSAIISWSTNEDADSHVWYGLNNSYSLDVLDNSFVTFHSVLLTNLTPGTTYHFQVSSMDKAGNWPVWSDDSMFTTSTKPDVIPPRISEVRVLGVTDRLAVIGWRTNEPADSAIDYGSTVNYNERAYDHQFLLIHSLAIDGLSPSTIYHFRVSSTDPSGNGPSTSPDLSFTTLALPDRTPPVISDIKVVTTTDRLAVISWETDEAADSAIVYGTTIAYGNTAGAPSLLRSHELTLANLEPAMTYHFRIKATDASGNGPSFSEDFTFTTNALPNTTLPTISNIRIQNVTGTSATITWDTDKPSDSLVEFGTTDRYGISAEDGSFTSLHMILLQGLKPGYTYHFRLHSTDPSGNHALPSNDGTFTTPKELPAQRLDTASAGMAALVLAIILVAFIVIGLRGRPRRKRNFSGTE